MVNLQCVFKSIVVRQSKFPVNNRRICGINTMTDPFSLPKGPSYLLPPKEVQGLKILDRKKFLKKITVPWLEVNERFVGGVVKCIKKRVLKLVCLKPVQPLYELLEGEVIIGDVVQETTNTGSMKRIFIDPTAISSFDDFEESQRTILVKLGVAPKLRFSSIVIGYTNWRADEILKAVLPDEKDCLTSYSIIGHIVHVNLRDHLLPYKQIIGEVLLDKVNGAKTVVNKTDTIDSTYRNFKMEVVVGENNLVTSTKQNCCVFELDFSAVYWNPRLATEHERILEKLQKGDILYDVFAGIGPFSIPAAKRKKCLVLANDLNPESFKWLNKNVNLNKVQDLISTFNKDGRSFIEEDVKEDMVKKFRKKEFKGKAMHITMNLPASAVSFLTAFCGLLKDDIHSLTISRYPVVHVYCFVSGDNLDYLAQNIVEESLGFPLDDNLIEIFHVRNVSPKKDMMRVSFKLSGQILMGYKNNSGECRRDNSELTEKQRCITSIPKDAVCG